MMKDMLLSGIYLIVFGIACIVIIANLDRPRR